MNLNLEIVKVNSDYCDYLRQFDNKIVYNKNHCNYHIFMLKSVLYL